MYLKKKLKIFVSSIDKQKVTNHTQQIKAKSAHEVSAFHYGLDCYNNLYQNPDVIFFDCKLDVLNGFRILKKIKTNKPQTYVVLISELDNLSMIGETFNLGSFDYIIKSEDAQEKMQHILKEIQLKKYKKKSSSN
jgi:PleD family two-component response regulator